MRSQAAPLMGYFRADPVADQLLELQHQVRTLRYSIDEALEPGDLVGVSAPFRTAWELLKKAANSQITVLLLGETGVGKEMFARALHKASSRANAPFVAVNCARAAGAAGRDRTVRRASRAPTPAPSNRAPAASSAPTAAPCSSTRWASCRCRRRPSCCGCCRKASSSASATPETRRGGRAPGGRHQHAT